ncbi:MAG: DUF5667 domain-containing protein [Chloroflexota bacterium]
MPSESRSFTVVLDEAMIRVLTGEPVASVCAAYPEHAAELAEALERMVAVRAASAFTPDPDRKRAARLRFHAALDARGNRRALWRVRLPRRLAVAGPRAAALSLVAVLAIVGSGTGTVLAAQSAVPGEALYPVKRSTERVQLAFAFDEQREADLRESLVERRMEELERVTAAGREQFVPELTEQIARHSKRMKAITVGRVETAVDTAASVALATPVPDSRPANGGSEVSVRKVVEVDDHLEQVQGRLDALREKMARSGFRSNVENLRTALALEQADLQRVLDRADQVRTQEEKPAAAGAQDAPLEVRPAPTFTPTPAPETESRLEKVNATVVDVKVLPPGTEPGVALALRDGDGVVHVVVLTRRGPAFVVGDGPASLRDLEIGGTVVVTVDTADGLVVEVRVANDARGD